MGFCSGGIGLTAQLASAYHLCKSPGMIESFACALTDAVQHNGNSSANMVIAVSEEADTYLPEMEWVCEKLRELGVSIEICSPQELQVSEETVLFKDKKVDLIYRFSGTF